MNRKQRILSDALLNCSKTYFEICNNFAIPVLSCLFCASHLYNNLRTEIFLNLCWIDFRITFFYLSRTSKFYSFLFIFNVYVNYRFFIPLSNTIPFLTLQNHFKLLNHNCVTMHLFLFWRKKGVHSRPRRDAAQTKEEKRQISKIIYCHCFFVLQCGYCFFIFNIRQLFSNFLTVAIVLLFPDFWRIALIPLFSNTYCHFLFAIDGLN